MDCRPRSKLVQAIVYLVGRSVWRGRQRLYWGLYLLDFGVAARGGAAVTGLEYTATVEGPWPAALDDELAAPRPDLAAAVVFDVLRLRDNRTLLALHGRQAFDPEPFTTLELTTLAAAADAYASPSAPSLSERAILADEPWRMTLEHAGAGSVIRRGTRIDADHARRIPAAAAG